MLDLYDLWEKYEQNQQKALYKRPICDFCGECIQEETYHEIEEKKICDICLNEMRRYVEV